MQSQTTLLPAHALEPRTHHVPCIRVNSVVINELSTDLIMTASCRLVQRREAVLHESGGACQCDRKELTIAVYFSHIQTRRLLLPTLSRTAGSPCASSARRRTISTKPCLAAMWIGALPCCKDAVAWLVAGDEFTQPQLSTHPVSHVYMSIRKKKEKNNFGFARSHS